MILTSAKAKQILEETREDFPDQSWINHSICVGDSAAKLAGALNEKGMHLDIEKARALGYIHDIGKKVGEFNKHVINGYNYLKEQGYDEEYCNISLTHSYLNNDYMCTAGGVSKNIPSRTKFIKEHNYTMYEKIINLCDLICIDKLVTVDKRIIDLIIKRGVYSNTLYHINETYKLKSYFDSLLGYDLYNLFPEIKDNI